MAESNATQVILTDDGIKIIKAQNTADNATSGITNLNDPNLMSVIEKQNNIGQFAGLTSQYNVLVQNAKDEGIDTAAVTTAYNNLNQFMADILADPNHASNVDRVTYKEYQDVYNEELSNLQNALQNNANNKFTSTASATSQAATMASQAASSANTAYSQAQLVGSQASSEIAIQSAATAKAQSAADNAFNQAQAVGSQASSAIAVQSATTAKAQSTADSAFSQAVTAIDNGKATSQAVTDLKDGSTLTIAELGNGLASKVSNSDYTTYKTQTANQIGQLVTNSNFSAYQQTTADLISSKVATKDFNTYTSQTATAIASKVANSDFSTYKTQTASQISSKVDNGTFSTYQQQTTDLISSKLATKDFSAYQDETAKEISSKVESSDFNTYKTQTASLIGSKVSNDQYQSDKTQTANTIASKVSTADFTTYQTQTANDINLRVTKGDLIDQINIQAGNTLISSSGQLTLSGKTIYFDSDNPVIIPSANIDTALVNKKLTAADISANTFTTNNGTFTVDSSGAITAKNMTIVDGTLTSPTINGSIINGSTINTPNLNMGDNGQITGDYSVHDDVGWFQPINGTGSLKIAHGYIQSTANIVYYNKILNGIGGDKWGHWASSTQFVPAPDQAHPDTCNVAESTLSPAFLKLGIYSADKSAVNSRVYIDGTGLYINDGSNSQAISAMLSDYELVSSGMAYLNTGIQMKQEASFTFGNLAMTGYHTIAMLDGNPLYFSDQAGGNGNPIEIKAKAFTKYSRLSVKHDITPLSTAESSRLLNAIDVEKFRYTHDGATYKYQYGGVIDDVNSLGSKQYSMPPELLSEDGTGINLDSLTGILVKRVQDQDKMIGELSMRLTRLEMEK